MLRVISHRGYCLLQIWSYVGLSNSKLFSSDPASCDKLEKLGTVCLSTLVFFWDQMKGLSIFILLVIRKNVFL